MDLIEDYLRKHSGSKKHRVSSFLLDYEEAVVMMQYETINEIQGSNLKAYWNEQFKNYNERFIFDWNLVNWTHLASLVRKKALQEQANLAADSLVAEQLKEKANKVGHTDKTNHEQYIYLITSFEKADDPFSASDVIPFNAFVVQLQRSLKQARASLSRTDDIHHQDFLYYGILDFVSNTEDKATMRVLNGDYDKWRKQLVATGGHCAGSGLLSPNHVYDYVKSIVKNADCKEELKAAKILLDKTDAHYRLKKAALKIIKAQRHQTPDVSREQNEYSFIIDYLSIIVKSIFNLKKDVWSYHWGETKLRASQEEENLAKSDDVKRSSGSSIDGIITLKELYLDYALLEVSGPMHKEAFTHFLKDRLKLAKNLKQLFKSIARKKMVLDEITALRLFGMHVYRNKIHLYCLSMPLLDMYCFSEVMSFDIPTNPALFPKELPRYAKNLIKMLNIVYSGYLILKKYITDHSAYVSDDTNSDFDILSPPYVSPQKNSSKRKTTAASNNNIPSSSNNKKQKNKA
ncbi:hypothetical protein MBANPS3_012070 [Mucor bainieri]